MPTKPTQERIRQRWIAHGSDWAEFEDLLIGDKDGLTALRHAVDDALAKGEGSLRDSDSPFLGVRVVDKHPNQGRPKQSIGWFASIFIILVGSFCAVCLVYGFIRLPELFK